MQYHRPYILNLRGASCATMTQVRAGEGESEAENYVLTNPVAKTSMSSGLTKRGTLQARTA